MTSQMSTEQRPAKQILYLDWLKLIAAFCVVNIHVVAEPMYNYSMPAPLWLVLNIYDSLCRFCVPAFFMASGAVFLSEERAFRFKPFLLKNIVKLIVVYVLWSAIYHLFELLVLDGASLSVTLHDIVHGDFIPGFFHLWFLPAMVGAYLCVPFLRFLCASQQYHKYCVYAAVAFIFLPSFLAGFPMLLTYTTFLDSLLPFSALYPAAYMVVGSYLHKTALQRRQRLALYLGGLVSTVMMIVLTQWNFSNVFYYPAYVFAFYNYEGLLVFMQACAVFVLVRQLTQARKGKACVNPRLLRSLAKYTFASYLVHMMIVETLGKTMLRTLPFSYPLSMPITSVTVFLISMGISWVLNRIPLVNRYLI